jgi:hypothetical protein
LPPNPDIKIFFSGLMILTPGDFAPPDARKTCVVFVNRSAADHHLTIEVRKKQPGNRPDVIIMRHAGPLPFSGVGQHGFLIRLSNETPSGVRKYEGPDVAEGGKLSNALDLKRLHAADVPPPTANYFDVDELGGRPSILIDEGILYTAALTPTAGTKIRRRPEAPGSGSPLSPDPFASILGLNVYLPNTPDGEDPKQLTLTWRGLNGMDNVLHLTKLAAGAYHEIYIDNDPLYEPDSPAAPRHEELTEYYKILPNVPIHQRFILEFPDDLPGRGSTRTPCNSALLGA